MANDDRWAVYWVLNKKLCDEGIMLQWYQNERKTANYIVARTKWKICKRDREIEKDREGGEEREWVQKDWEGRRGGWGSSAIAFLSFLIIFNVTYIYFSFSRSLPTVFPGFPCELWTGMTCLWPGKWGSPVSSNDVERLWMLRQVRTRSLNVFLLVYITYNGDS